MYLGLHHASTRQPSSRLNYRHCQKVTAGLAKPVRQAFDSSNLAYQDKSRMRANLKVNHKNQTIKCKALKPSHKKGPLKATLLIQQITINAAS